MCIVIMNMIHSLLKIFLLFDYRVHVSTFRQSCKHTLGAIISLWEEIVHSIIENWKEKQNFISGCTFFNANFPGMTVAQKEASFYVQPC